MINLCRSVNLAQKTLVSLIILGTFSLVGCNQSQPPTATIEPSTTEQNPPQATQPETPTLKNLQTAYNGESNANVMYLAFAEKADQEGYKEVASLFRAAAKAEEIHRDNHAKVIQAMGATPTNKITTPEVKTTAENLEAAIKGETYEKDTMYPGFISEAQKENNQAALQTLNYALAAETQHAKLYTEAKTNLADWRKETRPFYVCTASGEIVVSEKEAASCPGVTSGKAYQSVS